MGHGASPAIQSLGHHFRDKRSRTKDWQGKKLRGTRNSRAKGLKRSQKRKDGKEKRIAGFHKILFVCPWGGPKTTHPTTPNRQLTNKNREKRNGVLQRQIPTH